MKQVSLIAKLGGIQMQKYFEFTALFTKALANPKMGPRNNEYLLLVNMSLDYAAKPYVAQYYQAVFRMEIFASNPRACIFHTKARRRQVDSDQSASGGNRLGERKGYML